MPSLRNIDPERMPPQLRRGTSDLKHEYRYAKNRLAWANWEFDLRDETRERETFENKSKLRHSKGRKGIPQEEFDVLWVEHISKLTRKVIDAEKHFRKMRLAAVRGGVSIADSEATSVFDNDRSEGYPPSWNEVWVADIDKEDVEGWIQSLDTVPPRVEVGVAPSESDMQEDDGIAPWDSWSAAAEPRFKKKIARWMKTCTSTGKAPALTGH